MKYTLIALTTLAVITSQALAGFFEPDQSDIKVKGMYIGMPIEQSLVCLKEAIKGTSAESWTEHLKIEKQDNGTSKILLINGFGMPLVIVTSDAQGKVDLYALEYVAVNAMFNATDLSLNEFAQLFIDAYGIPELKPDENHENLVYTSPNGVKVAITKDKGVVVQKTQTQTERKAAFN